MVNVIGLKLKVLREKSGYTQKYVARVVGVSGASIHYYESGKRNIPEDLIPKFAELYGIKAFELYGVKPMDYDKDIKELLRTDQLKILSIYETFVKYGKGELFIVLAEDLERLYI